MNFLALKFPEFFSPAGCPMTDVENHIVIAYRINPHLFKPQHYQTLKRIIQKASRYERSLDMEKLTGGELGDELHKGRWEYVLWHLDIAIDDFEHEKKQAMAILDSLAGGDAMAILNGLSKVRGNEREHTKQS